MSTAIPTCYSVRSSKTLLALGFGAAVLMLFFFGSLFGGGTGELITAYAAGIFAVTARGSRITRATLAFGVGAGVAAGLTWYAAARTGNPWLPLVVVVVVFAAPTAAGAAAAWGTPGRDDPEALRRDRLRQGMAADALTGGVAALLITILIFGTMVVLHRQSPDRDHQQAGRARPGHRRSGAAMAKSQTKEPN